MTEDEKTAHAWEVAVRMIERMGAEAWTAERVIAHMDERYPAPPPPVTVTVRLRNGEDETLMLCGTVWHSSEGELLDFGAALADRIAADAAVIAEQGKRIAELEEAKEYWIGQVQAVAAEGQQAAVAAEDYRRERDEWRQRAEHPVVTRETVELVQSLLERRCLSGMAWSARAVEILTALGYTIQEGAS